MRTSLNELEAVIAIASTKSFRAAARELEMSPSALSHAIAALEQRLGVRLFHRTTRSVALTTAGASFVGRVQPAVAEIGAALEAVNELKERPSGVLRLASSVEGARLAVLPATLEMRRRYPEVAIELVTEDRLVDIVAEGFDAGVRLAEAVPQDMVAIPLGPPISMAVVGSPSYFRAHDEPRKPSDLLAHENIRRRFSSGRLMRWEFEKRGRMQVVDVPGSLTFDRDELVLAAARAGAGLAYVNDGALGPGLVRVLEDWTPPFPGLRLFHPSNRLMRGALRAFIDVIKSRR